MTARFVVVTALACASCQTQTYQQFRAGMAEGYGKVVPGASNVNEAQFVRVQGVLIPPIGATAKRCTIRTHEDDYAGFTIGFPQGWRLDYSTGTLLVEKDDQHDVGALVYPARLRRTDIPPERFATAFARGLERNLRAQGGTFDLSEQRTNGTIATAAMAANLHGVPMRGELQVVEEPGFMTLEAYWAPEATLLADQATLEQVLGCFSRKTLITRKEPVKPAGHATRIGYADAPSAAPLVAPMHAVSTKFFTLKLPAGWRVKDENPNGIDLLSADSYEYVGFGYVIGPAFGTPAQYMQQSINQFYPGVQMIGYSQPDEPGWSILAVEWGGTSRDQPIHGISRISQSANLRISIGWTAEPNHWQKDAATMAAIAATIRMTPAGVAQVRADIRQQLASYPPVRPSSLPSSSSASSSGGGDTGMAGWEDARDRANLGADDALRDQDRAVSPSTGEHYVVPTNAWSASGPDGPGYYRALPGGGEERLNVENVITGTTE